MHWPDAIEIYISLMKAIEHWYYVQVLIYYAHNYYCRYHEIYYNYCSFTKKIP